jgi:hypothetical protein
MWSSWIGKKEYNSCHVYCKAKGWFQKSQETFQINLEKGVWQWNDRRRRRWSHTKRFEVEMILSSIKITSLSTCKTFGAFCFFFSSALSLYSRMNSGAFENILGEKQNFNLSLDGMNVVIPSIWNWGVVNILVVDAYSGMEFCMPIFLGEASKKNLWKKNRFEKISKLKKNTSLNKSQQEQELLCGSKFGFGRSLYVDKEHF